MILIVRLPEQDKDKIKSLAYALELMKEGFEKEYPKLKLSWSKSQEDIFNVIITYPNENRFSNNAIKGHMQKEFYKMVKGSIVEEINHRGSQYV